MRTINLAVMPSGARYEDVYGAYLDIFALIAGTPPDEEVVVLHPPLCWIPLLRYLQCEVRSGQEYFPCDAVLVGSRWISPEVTLTRTEVETIVGLRPELVDALWKCDMQWKSARPRYESEKSFIVTSNGSFHRKEVVQFMEQVSTYRSAYKNIVLVPCAADKPYPSPLHMSVLNLLGPSWELAVATGVLGIVPQSLWHQMPWYDSGVPNEWRLFQVAKQYFSVNKYDRIVCYIDYYSLALKAAFDALGREDVVFVNPVQFYSDYLDLRDPARLAQLAAAVR